MHIIDTYNLSVILDHCGIRFDPHIKQFRKGSGLGAGKFMLIMEIVAPETVTGIGISNMPTEQIWVLNREVEDQRYPLLKRKLFEFEIIDDSDSGKKMFIISNVFIEILKENKFIEEFGIENISDTVGLGENDAVKKMYADFSINRARKFKSLQPPQYYDEHFGIKSEEEKKLLQQAKQVTDRAGSHEGASIAIDFYSKAIMINPLNAHAFFGRAIASLDDLQWKKSGYLFKSIPKEELDRQIKELEDKHKSEAQSDFDKAISLNPYLEEVFYNLKKSGRIKL